MNSAKILTGNWIIQKALLFSSLALINIACDHRDSAYYPSDFVAPPVPSGVISTTMDQAILLSWNPVNMDPNHDDLAGYRIYRSNNNSLFDYIATVDANITEYLDQRLENGRTYYYAVSSFDYNDNESELSTENVFDTPRPEGYNVRIYSFNDPSYEHLSGFDFSMESRLPWNHRDCDFYLEYDNSPTIQTFFLWLGNNGAFIQDMGYTDSFDDITFAPNDGWSQLDYVEAIAGHTYVILTHDNHYAKVRLTLLSYDPTYNAIFDWGYQIDAGNRELKINAPAQQPATVVEEGAK